MVQVYLLLLALVILAITEFPRTKSRQFAPFTGEGDSAASGFIGEWRGEIVLIVSTAKIGPTVY